MDKIKEFAEKCKIVTTITIVYKELYGRLIEKKTRKNTIQLFKLGRAENQPKSNLPNNPYADPIL